MAVLPSYRNQSIDLHRKSIDWFLHEGNTDNKWVKKTREVNGNKFHPQTEQMLYILKDVHTYNKKKK